MCGVVFLFEERCQAPGVVSVEVDCVDKGVEGSPMDRKHWAAGVEHLETLVVVCHRVEIYF